jgi:hypothetical protein
MPRKFQFRDIPNIAHKCDQWYFCIETQKATNPHQLQIFYVLLHGYENLTRGDSAYTDLETVQGTQT